MKNGPELTDDEVAAMIEADIAYEEALIGRAGQWWWRTYLLLCLLPGCAGLAIDLVTWLERRYPAKSDGSSETQPG